MESGVRTQEPSAHLRLGIWANLDQFLVQTLLVFFVGITIGLERNVVPILAKDEFTVGSTSLILLFVVSFGVVKAALNLWDWHCGVRVWGLLGRFAAGQRAIERPHALSAISLSASYSP